MIGPFVHERLQRRLVAGVLVFAERDVVAVNQPGDVNVDKCRFVLVVPVRLEQLLVEADGFEDGRIVISVLPVSRGQDAGDTLRVPRHEFLRGVEDGTVRRKLEGVLRLGCRLLAAGVELQRLLRDEVVQRRAIGVRQRGQGSLVRP